MSNADCDLIAGNSDEKYCIEVKSSKKPYKYISKDQMENFIIFSQIFDLEPIVAVRFNRKGWFFLEPEDLEETGKSWKVDLEMAREKGKRFGQAFG
jgi:Holliday junction resolvase